MSADGVVELRVYRLEPGRSASFDHLMRDGIVPMLRRYRIRVVEFGPCAVHPDHYYLVRTYPSLPARQEALAGFYGGEEWSATFAGPADEMIADLTTVVLPAGAPLARAVSASFPGDG